VHGLVGRVARIAATAVLGMALGFLVAVSAFADAAWGERAVTLGALLLAYGLAGVALGFRASAWYGLGLALPGLAALAARGEGRWWYLPFAALVAALAAGGAYGGAVGSRRRRPVRAGRDSPGRSAR
jgi:hypothetical protein